MCTYNIILWCQNTRNNMFIIDYQAHGLLLQMLLMTFLDTFPNTVHVMLNIEQQIEKLVLHLYKTIQ